MKRGTKLFVLIGTPFRHHWPFFGTFRLLVSCLYDSLSWQSTQIKGTNNINIIMVVRAVSKYTGNTKTHFLKHHFSGRKNKDLSIVLVYDPSKKPTVNFHDFIWCEKKPHFQKYVRTRRPIGQALPILRNVQNWIEKFHSKVTRGWPHYLKHTVPTLYILINTTIFLLFLQLAT